MSPTSPSASTSSVSVRGTMVALCVALVASVLPVAFSGSAGAQSLDDADSVPSGAEDLGDVTDWDPPERLDRSFDGVDDSTDYFGFSLSEPKLVGVALRRLDFDADLFLEDSSGSVLASAETAGSANESIRVGLVVGSYFIRVVAREAGSNDYRLRLGAEEAPDGTVFLGGPGSLTVVGPDAPDPEDGLESSQQNAAVDPDATREGARDLGDVTGLGALGPVRDGSWSDAVNGGSDDVDYFAFSLSSERLVGVLLRSMERDADVFVEDSSGTVLASSVAASNEFEKLNVVLAAGSYFVRVEAYGRGSNTYDLQMGTAAPDGPTSDFDSPAVVEVGACFDDADARIAPYWDIDWVRVDLVAGEEYVLEVRGDGSGSGTLIDPELVGIYVDPTSAVHSAYGAAGRLTDKGGGRVGRAYDFDGGEGQDAWLLFRAEATGSHWLKVISQGGFAGTYVVAAATAAEAPATCASPPGMVRAEAEALNDMMARVSWDEPKDGGAPITGYVVEYRKKGDSQWTRHDKTAGPTARSVDIPNLEPGEEYEFQVFAQNAAGAGEPSPITLAVTLAPGEGNQPPELVSPQTGLQHDENTVLDVAVVASDVNIGDSIEQVQVVASTPPNVFSLTGDLLNGDLRLISNGLLDHERGPHSVTLKLTSGRGDRELSVEATLHVTVRDVAEPPTVPQNFEATPTSGTSVTLEWEASTTTGPQAINYAVGYRPVGDSWIAADDGPELTQTITGLTPDTDYEFRVEATNAEGTSGYTRVTAHTPAAAGLVVSESSLDIGEDGSETFTVRLATQPSADVSVSVTSGDPGAATVDLASLTFTTTDWGTAQTVTVSGVADDDGADESLSVGLSATGGDYAGETASVAVSVTDDDIANLVVSESSLDIGEDGSETFTVRLATQPSADVSVSVTSGDPGAATVDLASLTFTTTDWGTAQTVTVSGVADDDGADESLSVGLSATGGDYANKTASVAVSVTDDDDPDLVVDPTTLTVAEDGSEHVHGEVGDAAVRGCVGVGDVG